MNQDTTIREWIKILEAIAQGHGDETKIKFLHKYKSGRTTVSSITGYKVHSFDFQKGAHVTFTLDWARGEFMEAE